MGPPKGGPRGSKSSGGAPFGVTPVERQPVRIDRQRPQCPKCPKGPKCRKGPDARMPQRPRMPLMPRRPQCPRAKRHLRENTYALRPAQRAPRARVCARACVLKRNHSGARNETPGAQMGPRRPERDPRRPNGEDGANSL